MAPITTKGLADVPHRQYYILIHTFHPLSEHCYKHRPADRLQHSFFIFERRKHAIQYIPLFLYRVPFPLYVFISTSAIAVPS